MKNIQPISTKDKFYFKSVDEYKKERYIFIIVTTALGIIGFCWSYLRYAQTLDTFWMIVIALSILLVVIPLWFYNHLIAAHQKKINDDFKQWLHLYHNLSPYGEITFMQGRQLVLVKDIAETLIIHMRKSDITDRNYLEVSFDSV